MNALKTPPFLSKTFVIFFDAMALSAILLATTYMMFDAGVSSIVIPVVFFSGVIVICMVLPGVYKTRPPHGFRDRTDLPRVPVASGRPVRRHRRA